MNEKNIAKGLLVVIGLVILIFVCYAFSLEPDTSVVIMGDVYQSNDVRVFAVVVCLYAATMTGLGLAIWVFAPLGLD